MKYTCKQWKSCKHVPNGGVMMGCRPSYTSKGSKNWSRCNMSEWGGPNKKTNKLYCKKEGLTNKCKYVKNAKISKDQIDAEELHKKMPVIWRYLDIKTRKKIIKTATSLPKK